MLKNYTVDGRKVRKGKVGAFTDEVADKMIKAGAAEEVVLVSDLSDILSEKETKQEKRFK